ncbi:hypothetical protein PENPOL_c002G06214 [Penicillium polonicum]|uniref:Uncharacterized protein n=1 Tax=Penicillium polonicum TaxID=60169 RepID=A0A1V6NXP1_PENPO|nr:hypothetical protein PENPOL_c002G06214 [Penicillium polonicum]
MPSPPGTATENGQPTSTVPETYTPTGGLWATQSSRATPKLNHEGWYLGVIVVSLKRLRPPADVTLAFNVDFDSYDWSKLTPIPTFNCATRQQELIFQD